MLVFNEGVPRSGKSYDAVESHILPALASGRRVYARLNGIEEPTKRQAIAAHVGITSDRLDELLVHVPSAQVHELFRAEKVDGEWIIPAKLQDCLFVIDEVHGFYVAGRRALDPAHEEFFALIGQNGGDGVLMSQYWNRLHSAIRGRVERKNSFQKLTAVGMDGRYLVTRYHAIGAGRFEKVGSETKAYDPAIFPLYRGYATGSQNREVYKSGGVTIWKRLRKFAVVIVPLLVLSVWFLWRFFHGEQALTKEQPHAPVAVGHVAPRATVIPAELGGPSSPFHAAKAGRDWPAGPAYVWELSAQGRARLAAVATGSAGKLWGVIEWPDDGGKILDRLTFEQLRALGVTVRPARFGVVIEYGGKSIVVTAWPFQSPDAVQGQGVIAQQPPQSAPQPSVTDASASPTAWHVEPVAAVYVPPQAQKPYDVAPMPSSAR